MGMKHRSLWLAWAPLLAISGCGGAGGGNGSPATPAPQSNTPPTITTPSALNVVEGQTTVAELQATDPDGNIIQFSLGGTDASHFVIANLRTLATSTDLEVDAPEDANGDNVYEITLTATDGTANVSVNVMITITNIPLDGIAKINGSANPSPAGDLTGDGIDDLLVSSPEPANVPAGYSDPGYILYRNGTIGESSVILDLQALATAPNFVRGARQLRATADYARFVHGFLSNPAGAPLEYAGLLTTRLSPTAPQIYDATMLFPDEISGAFSGVFFIDLSNDPFPTGIRSTRDQVNLPYYFIRLIGDLDGDGTSDAILEAIFDLFANSDPAIEFTVTLIDGSLIRDMPAGLFASVTDLPTQATTLTFAAANYIIPSSFGTFVFEDYAEPGSADVNGDGIDDFVRLVGLRGSQPVNPPPDMPASPEGHEIIVVSGNALTARPKGLNDIDSFSDTELFRITIPEAFLSPQVAAVGDVNDDGYADILITTFVGGPANPGGSEYPAYLISGAALSSAGVIALNSLPDSGGTAISISGPFDVALITSDLIGTEGRDLILTLKTFIPGTSPIMDVANAIVLSGDLFSGGFPAVLELADPNTLSLSDGLEKLPAGSFARILSPRTERNFGGPSTEFIAVASIGDGDGDGFRDLALTDRRTTSTTNFDTYIVPSGRLRAVAATGDSINLETVFAASP